MIIIAEMKVTAASQRGVFAFAAGAFCFVQKHRQGWKNNREQSDMISRPDEFCYSKTI
jgi:hypothetical protein